MILSAYLLLLSSIGSALCQVQPQPWPQVFHQAFVQTDTTNFVNIQGKIYFDSKRNAQRMDRTDGQYQQFCGSILPNVSSPCIELIRQQKKYIIHQERRMCCICCDQSHGCGITKRDWVSTGKYQGQQAINGQYFYKWSLKFGNYTDYYYTTKTEQRITRRIIENISKKMYNFIVNTFSTDPIPQSVFNLPSYCHNTMCPATTNCGKYQKTLQIQQ